jgi:hypothetical protein
LELPVNWIICEEISSLDHEMDVVDAVDMVAASSLSA